MRLQPISGDLVVKAVLIAAGVAVAIYGLQRAQQALADLVAGPLKAAKDLADQVGQVADQVIVEAGSAWNNNIAGPFNAGWAYGSDGSRPIQTDRQVLYSDAGYAGTDAQSGLDVASGEWYADQVARSYENDQRAAGTLPAYTSTNGAAFGVFPQMGTSAAQRAALAAISGRGRVVGGL